LTDGGTFVAKYNTNGVFQWGTTISGNNVSYPYGSITDSANNLYVTGEYFANPLAIFDAGNTTVTPDYTLPKFGSNDAYLIKYDTNGIVQWATHVSSSDVAQGMDVGVDAANNVYLSLESDTTTQTNFFNAGNSSTTADLSIPAVIAGSYNQYIAKYTDLGVVQWASHITCFTPGSGAGFGFGLTTDSAGNSYTTGEYSLPNATFYNSDGSIFTSLPLITPLTVYVTKIDPNGFFCWATSIGGAASTLSYDVALDTLGELITVGGYNSNPLYILDVGVTGASGTTGATGLSGVSGVYQLNNSGPSGTSDGYIVKYTAGPTVFLPPGLNCGDTKIIAVTGGIGVTIVPTGGVTIASTTGNLISGCMAGAVIKLLWNGTQWVIVSNNGFSV
jgi:hypothetical protein